MYTGIKTTELDQLAAETCGYMSLAHPEYSTLAARIVVNSLHKETKESGLSLFTEEFNFSK